MPPTLNMATGQGQGASSYGLGGSDAALRKLIHERAKLLGMVGGRQVGSPAPPGEGVSPLRALRPLR